MEWLFWPAVARGSGLDYPITRHGNVTVVMLSGDVDMYRTPDARRTILGCITGKNTVLVDLSAVNYIDSSGVASLVEGYQAARKQNTLFALVGVSAMAMNVLRLANLDRVFPIHASVEDYLHSAD